jgi:hypothetical protein
MAKWPSVHDAKMDDEAALSASSLTQHLQHVEINIMKKYKKYGIAISKPLYRSYSQKGQTGTVQTGMQKNDQ